MPDDLPAAVYHALGFGKRGTNPFREIFDRGHNMSIALAVRAAVQDGHKLEFAFADVARAHPAQCTLDPPCTSISTATVRRYWRRHGGLFPTVVIATPKR